MGPTPTATYIYAYVAFAAVYLAAAAACVIAAFQASSRLARCARGSEDTASSPQDSTAVVTRAFRLLDWIQGAVLLPIVYVVVSTGLGSLILKGQPAAVMNLVWLTLTALSAGAALVLAVLGTREVAAIRGIGTSCAVDDRTARDLERISTRLGASGVALLLAGAFVAVNLISVLSDLGALLKTDFLL